MVSARRGVIKKLATDADDELWVWKIRRLKPFLCAFGEEHVSFWQASPEERHCDHDVTLVNAQNHQTVPVP